MYYKIVYNNYIIAISKSGGIKITEKEYNDICSELKNKPTAEEGYDYYLTNKTMKWEKVKIDDGEKTETDIEKLYNTFTKEQIEMVKNSKILSEIFNLG